MPTAKKPRNKGITYKLVPRSYGDAEGEEGPVWVSEAEFYRNHQAPAAVDDNDKAQQQFNMYAAAANAEFKEERRNRRRTEADDDGLDENVGAMGGALDDAEDGEWVDGDWEEEGEWDEEEGEWDEEEDVDEEMAVTSPPTRPAAAASSSPSSAAAKRVGFAVPAVTSGHAASPASTGMVGRTHLREEKRARDDGDAEDVSEDAEEDEEDEKLFEDEVEAEVTDDFLRQLVFGGVDSTAGGEGDDAFMMDEEEEEEGEDWDGLDQEDAEMWRLLTDEEKAAIKASRRRGTARRRRAGAGEGAEVSRTHAADGTEYPTHDVTQRALDRQFTEMMREFNADARLNDAYTDDPRTHGALPMEKYMAALEEFVTDRAGMDVETAEPHKNKGLIQQLKYLSHHAGAFDSDGRGTYMTTMLPEKQQRFVEDFQKGTEEIRRAARMRVAQRQHAAMAAALVASPSATTSAEQEDVAVSGLPRAAAAAPASEEAEDEKEEMMILEVKPKVDRLDCETAVSAYSTYYNQPNIIQPPRKSAAAQRQKKSVGVVKGNVISAVGSAEADSGPVSSSAATKPKKKKKAQRRIVSSEDEDESSSEDSVAGTALRGSVVGGLQDTGIVPTVRPKGETKEEKKLRRQAVKAAQRERREAKSALKSMYKEVESEEVKRSATSHAARRTVHFM